MARRSSSTDAVVLGLGFAVDPERERGEKPGAQVEGLVPDLILAQQRPGWTETASGGGGATARVGGTEVEGDRVAFARSPLPTFLVFAGRSFSLLFLFSFYFFSVFDLFGQANELQNL